MDSIASVDLQRYKCYTIRWDYIHYLDRAELMTSPRIAIITGCAGGIGRSIALQLAEDGCDIVVNDLEKQIPHLNTLIDEIKSKGRKAVSYVGDMTVENNVKEMVELAVSVFGGIDIMVANAGIAFMKAFIDVSVEELDRMLAINVKGVFLSYKYAAAQMIKQGRGGRIIGASSIAGKKGYPFSGPYSASKFAVRGLTQSAAQEWGAHGITVNAYCPGVTQTSMAEGLATTLVHLNGSSEDETWKRWAKATSLGRVGQTQDIANIVSFLASEKSGFITGQSILVDGGVLFD